MCLVRRTKALKTGNKVVPTLKDMAARYEFLFCSSVKAETELLALRHGSGSSWRF